tara:strand:+ start:6902 stop:7096 length:195 start_codon:yes stop_codon:yes gene_type:complete
LAVSKLKPGDLVRPARGLDKALDYGLGVIILTTDMADKQECLVMWTENFRDWWFSSELQLVSKA